MKKVVLLLISAFLLSSSFLFQVGALATSETTGPIAVFTTNLHIPPTTSSGYIFNVGLLSTSGHSDNPIVEAMPIPVEGISSSDILVTVDYQRQLLFTTTMNSLSDPALIALSVGDNLYGYSNPHGTIWGIYTLDPSQIKLNLNPNPAWGIHGMAWSAKGMIYMIWVNSTRTKEASVTTYSYAISGFNTTSYQTTYLNSSSPIPLENLPSNTGAFTSAFDSTNGVYYFMGLSDPFYGYNGNVLGYDTSSNTFSVNYQITASDPLFQCVEWTHDSASGTIFSICKPSSSTTVLSSIQVETNQVTEIGTIFSNQPTILPGSFTVDPKTNNGYFAWWTGSYSWIQQVDLSTGVSTWNSSVTDSEVEWMVYAKWLQPR